MPNWIQRALALSFEVVSFRIYETFTLASRLEQTFQVPSLFSMMEKPQSLGSKEAAI